MAGWNDLSEITKLLIIIVPGFLAIVIGFIRIKMKKETQFESMSSYSGEVNKTANFSPTLSDAEEKAKNYINQYKDSYPRESLKVSLVNSGNSEPDVDSWLDKYM